MIAIATPTSPANTWQDVFLTVLPAVRRQAWRASRGMPYRLRQDFVADVAAHVAVAIARLARRGRLDVAFATPLTNYAVKRVRSGRCVGGRLNIHDVTSAHCGLRNAVRIVHFDDLPDRSLAWRESLLEDRRAGPAQTAAARIDLGDWLSSLPIRNRRIAKMLAIGESTTATAKVLGLTPGRISQLRRKLEASWLAFQGEAVVAP